MKALLLFLFACTASFAQEFTVTATGGLVSKKDTKSEYVIAYSKGIPADTLYTSAKKYIEAKSADTQIAVKSDDPGKILIFETTDAPVSTLKKKNEEVTYSTSFTTSLEFKDGKTRITYGNIIVYITNSKKEKTDYPLTSIYNSKGKVTDQQAKNLVESYFSANAKAIVAALKSDAKSTTSADW
jgi:hypothetical protein